MRINRLAWALWTAARVVGVVLLIPTIALQSTGVQRSYSGDYNILFLIGVCHPSLNSRARSNAA
jgi:hypothetical protein